MGLCLYLLIYLSSITSLISKLKIIIRLYLSQNISQRFTQKASRFTEKYYFYRHYKNEIICQLFYNLIYVSLSIITNERILMLLLLLVLLSRVYFIMSVKIIL